MRTIIAGSREITDYALVEAACRDCGWTITEVVSGGARGVDRLGERWAREHNVRLRVFKPDWGRLGSWAGFARNRDMAAYGEALIVIWDGSSSGTANMAKEARARGLRFFLVTTGRK